MSLTELSRKVSYSKGYLSKIENGDKPPTYELARACDAALGTGGQLLGLVPRLQRGLMTFLPSQLPAEGADFVGRDRELRLMESFLADGSTVVVVSGAPGVGKTALALRWAHQVRDRFPDGSLFTNLRGYDPSNEPIEPTEVLDSFLRALNVPLDSIPTTMESRASLFRTILDRKRVLLVLDNAYSVRQVRPLLPSSPNCLVIVTSRRSLPGLVAREGARRVVLEPLPEPEAITLLRRRIGATRADSEPEAVEALAAHCAYLPLALRVASEWVGSRPRRHLTDMAQDLASARTRLDALSVEDDATTAVRSVFSWSYRALPTEAARLFRLLGLHGGAEFSVGAAAALFNSTPREVRRWLDTLSSMHLVSEVAATRFRFHDLLWLYARERAQAEESAESRKAAVGRLVSWYLRSATAANKLLAPAWHPPLVEGPCPETEPEQFTDYREALNWCELECDNLVAASRLAYDHGFAALAWKLPVTNWDYFHLRKRWAAWIDAHEVALLSTQRIGDRRAEAWVRNNLGIAYCDLRKFDQAFSHLRESFIVREQLDDDWGRAWSSYGLATTHQAAGELERATVYYENSLVFFEETDDLLGKGLCLAGLADLHRVRGEVDQALATLRRAVRLFRALEDRHAEGYAATKLGATLREAGRTQEALDYFRQSLAISRQAGDRQGEAFALDNLALVLHESGQREQAQDHWLRALRILDELGDPRVNDIRARLSTTDGVPPVGEQ
ncbi:Helix-turn-helix [Amycolatopsis arida]|uniref:Helix-turn-helix n=2 Tax=Amycolatopsis arida TaxID=587909 RepID=A0A1I5LBW5_9PSEU|nr:helix-turn-helix protein [Amycolatopsis arida]SFO94201.1 Helix-turn-helix [Amycolatopsis arida]